MTKEVVKKDEPGQQVIMCGHKFTVYPPKIVDPYERMVLDINGLQRIVGPTAPNLDTYIAMLKARVKAKVLAQEVCDKLLDEIRGKQVETMVSDPNGDATDEIITQTVSANVHVFARDGEGVLGLQSYAFRAALRECFSESGFFKSNRGTRERFREGLGVWPLFLRLERNGKPLTEPDGIDSRPIHVWAGGKKSDSIVQFEYVDTPWNIRVMLEARHDSMLKLEDAANVLSLLRTVGLGAQRSMGYGRCEVGGVSEVLRAKTLTALAKKAV